MLRTTTLLFLLLCFVGSRAQQVETIVFNLYTDSLKKGFYNYISVDGKLSDGQWLPLDSTHLKFRANTGHFKGNDLFIDSAYLADSVEVEVVLKSNPKIRKQATIYIRKRGFDEPLKSEEEILNEQKPKPRRKARSLLA